MKQSFRTLFLFLPALITTTTSALAVCKGADLIAAMPEEDRAELEARVAAQPYSEGNLWRAEKPGNVIHVAGTMHLPDPRHEALLTRLDPIIAEADRVYLEATPEDMAQVQQTILAEPSMMFLEEGPTLLERLPEDEWERLSAELGARGVPGFLAAKMQPWYAGMMLDIPPCAMEGLNAAGGGLDHLIAERAQAKGVPVARLEDPLPLLREIAYGPFEEQMDMLRISLSQARFAEDGYSTMLNTYFAGEHVKVWEFYRMQSLSNEGDDPEKLAELYRDFESRLLTGRNFDWMDVLREDATEGNFVVAVGAAHLGGTDGILDLLARDGYELTKVD